MLRVPLRWKIVAYTSLLLVALIAGMLVFVNYQAEGFVNRSIAADFEQRQRRVQHAESERLAYLKLTAQLVASFPELRALLATDLPTIRDFLLAYQQQNQRSELLIVLDPTGRVVARTDTIAAEPAADAERLWVRPALARGAATGILVTGRGVYHAAAVPAAAGERVFGFVMAGASVDNALAQELADVTQGEVAVVGERILGSTMGVARLPWKTAAEWEKNAGGAAGPTTVDLAGESYAALPVLLGSGIEPRAGELRVLAVLLRSRDRALAPYRRIQAGLLSLGLLVALVGIAASAVMAGRLTYTIGDLVEGTKRVAAGNFDSPLQIRSRDEVGELAQAFNLMMRGLRERADMEKFVSQSTVEMIQASQRRDSAGERRVMTIFFSDVRGFTTMSQDRAPEEVVQWLNACLSLQAERVKKYQGDVDKYVGDSVVALFLGEDSAFNAIRCAVEIVKALDGYNAEHPNQQPVQVGIGIVTGEAILGSIGSEDRRDYTAIGPNVNLCARLCSLAKPREILLAESSYRLVRDLVAAERLEPQQVKGFSEAIPVYRVGGK